ncbi:MAG: S9 family peptidase, partial [Pedobacter sp.]
MMLYKNCLFCLLMLFCLSSCSQDQGGKIIPVNDFFKSQERMTYRISPDGKNISFLMLQGKDQNLYLEDVNTGKSSQVTNIEGKKINFYFWVNSNELIYYREIDPVLKRSDIFIINKDGSNERQLTNNEKSKIRVLEDQLIEDKYLLVSSNRRDSTVFDVYRLNVRNGKMEMAAQNPGNITNWITDVDGKLRLATSSDGVNETFLYRSAENESFRPIMTNNFKTTLRPIAFA